MKWPWSGIGRETSTLVLRLSRSCLALPLCVQWVRNERERNDAVAWHWFVAVVRCEL